ncbi:diguanylate cyclase/phosphodiesterase (GGDEF & EAL domains) with PAS/PAC sensor(s) [hydrothermal vent metagenome]|uniref:Diguanylate cyclase/phosphodiesterase (GGDEF & EAL domains) with PAS/PAC sensor(S) n=1 Tax=hydrothermal vent metagenome TaxID=652676 RepID=A0A3B1ATJ7_9ZZZZ
MNGKVVSVIQNQKVTGDNKLQEILDSLPHGVAVFNQQLILTQWNKKLLTLLGLEKESFEIVTNLNDILHINWSNQQNDGRNNFAAKIIYELAKAKTSDELFPFSYEYHITQEKTLDIKGEVMPNSGMILTFSDITLRSNPNYYLQSTPAPHEGDISGSDSTSILEARSDREIMEQEAVKAIQMAEDLAITREIAENTAKHIEAILNAISDVLITMDAKGNILTCNHAVKNMFGYSSLELIGKNLLYILKTTQVISEKDFEIFITSLEEEEQLKKHSGTGFKNCGTAFPVELNIREVNISGEKQFTIVISDVTERHEAEILIRRMALHDSLTGLANRNLLQQRLDESLRMAIRTNNKLSVMFLDLDGFKPVNDIYGHATGDKLLRIIADRLEGCAREVDTVARLGGDEFAIISTNIKKETDSIKAAQRVLDNVRKPILINGNTHNIGASIGISFFPDDSQNPEELFRMADVALYQAKNNGKNHFRLYNLEMDAQSKKEKQIEVDLEKAIQNDELLLHYQPMLSTIDDSIAGAEALVRWQHPEKGMIPPFDFIPVAENSDLMLILGQKILEMACMQAKIWQEMDLPRFRVCVNISARQFQSKDFVDNVKNAIANSKIDSRGLELEITEGMVIGDTESVARKLEVLAEMGISLAIDDFGTGYSSLAYLKRFPVHQLKIDRSFINDITEDHDDAAITDAVIRLGHSLGLTVVAEGVETLEQAQILRQKGCDVLQGYYFSKPISADEFEQWLIVHTEKIDD